MTPRYISNTETAMPDHRKLCNKLSCDFCNHNDDDTPMPRIRRPVKQTETNARRRTIIEAQERLAQGI